MKRLLFSIVASIVLLSANAQSAVYTFYFDDIYIKNVGETKNKTGNGKLVIYDNLEVIFEGHSESLGHFRKSLNIKYTSNYHDAFIYLYDGPDKDKDNIVAIGSDAINAFFWDKRASDGEKTYGLFSGNNNVSEFESFINALNNHTGIFSSFRSTDDIELPLAIEGHTSSYSVTIPANGEEKAYAVRTKTGKTVADTQYKSFEVTSDASWVSSSFQTESAFLLKSEKNTTGRTRTAHITVKPKGYNGDKATVMTVKQPGLVAKVNRVWVEHNKFKGLVKGMKIHVEFETFNVKGITGYCNAYFSFSNGNKLYDYNGNYRAADGQVCCPGTFRSGYDSTTYNDFVLFMPYTELHINGRADCYFIVEVQVNGQSAASEKVSFRFN